MALTFGYGLTQKTPFLFYKMADLVEFLRIAREEKFHFYRIFICFWPHDPLEWGQGEAKVLSVLSKSLAYCVHQIKTNRRYSDVHDTHALTHTLRKNLWSSENIYSWSVPRQTMSIPLFTVRSLQKRYNFPSLKKSQYSPAFRVQDMEKLLLCLRMGLWFLVKPVLWVAFLQWTCTVQGPPPVLEPWQAHQPLLKTRSALAGISGTNQTCTVQWLKNVMLIINWKAHSMFREFFCRKAAGYKKCIKHMHHYSCLNSNSPVSDLYEPCYSFVYSSEESLITSPPQRPLGRVKEAELRKKSGVDLGKFNTALETNIHSFIHQ